MKALYKKETLQDPESENSTYSSYTLKRDTEFCCEKFKNYCKKFTGWNYEQGKFAIVDQITYEVHSVKTIDFCPFCGQEIEYEDENIPKKTKRKKNKNSIIRITNMAHYIQEKYEQANKFRILSDERSCKCD